MKRYPGLHFFETSQYELFFGRDKDIENVSQSVFLNSTTVLYSKSGLGKSSLINAGVIPYLSKIWQNEIEFIKSRFTAYVQGAEPSLINILAQNLESKLTDKQSDFYLDKIDNPTLKKEYFLWFLLKKLQYVNGKNKFLIIFDQFEELFTYLPENILDFKKQIALTQKTQIPQKIKNAINEAREKGIEIFNKQELNALYAPIEFKILIGIRSDKLSNLNKLKDYLTDILSNCYELSSLNNKQAKNAIQKPAQTQIDNMVFDSPLFEYEPEALDYIIKFLSKDDTKPIETFQLQIICETIEREIVIEKKDYYIEVVDLGFMENVFERYYESIISQIDAEEQIAVRKLIEDAMIYEPEERRITLLEGQIVDNLKISSEILKKLINSHIIRCEQNANGDFIYEISHDTLVEPILKSKKIRQEQEWKDQETKRHNEKLQLLEKVRLEEKAKRDEELLVQRQRMRKRNIVLAFSLVGIIICLVLVASLYFKNQETKKLNEESNKLNAKIAKIYRQRVDRYIEQKRYNVAKTYALLSLLYSANSNDTLTNIINTTPNYDGALLFPENDPSFFKQYIEIQYSKEKKILALSDSLSASAYLYKFNGNQPQCFDTLRHKGDIHILCFSPNGKSLASVGYDNCIKLWQIQRGETSKLFDSIKCSRPVNNAIFSPEGKYFVFTAANTLYLHNNFTDSNADSLYLRNNLTDSKPLKFEADIIKICFHPAELFLYILLSNSKIVSLNMTNYTKNTIVDGMGLADMAISNDYKLYGVGVNT